MAGTRHKARELALQALYEADIAGHPPEEALERLLAEAEPGAAEFSRELVRGVVQHRQAIDGRIRRHAPNWPLEQISAIDRNVLRVAIFEILFNNKVPVKVAINEAVDLAKTFGSDNSSKFVNGVLGAISTSITT
ncbi:MAG TPA: transcription antitermination factor NusB [Dehalococcoidia bacterium]|nr:transcription antitermination factor NusB [Dehalococcoidia bacterium]